MLGELARAFTSEPVALIGVHSSKFPGENDPSRVAETMAHYGISHPVVMDGERGIWQSYAVRAWPTLVLIRPDGTIAATLPGEPDPENLAEIVSHLLDEGLRLGTLGSSSVTRPGDGSRQSPGMQPLAFPGKAEPIPTGLAISDSGHHRLLLVDGRGGVSKVVGDGTGGHVDGPPSIARFRNPQGMAYAESRLFVADAGNHALRSVDLETGHVDTVAGTSALGRLQPSGIVPASRVALRSPWDLAYVNGYLFVAMAGFHQIWAYLTEDRTIGVFAGSGREALVDGVLHEAAFAQPTAITAHGGKLYVADSETSAVREIDLAENQVRTLVGAGLFDYGDRDGDRASARLQHVQGVSHGKNGLLVSDTYNNKVKKVDVDAASGSVAVTTWFHRNGAIELNEPTGLSQLASGQVLVADSHSHRIVVVNGATGEAKVLPLAL